MNPLPTYRDVPLFGADSATDKPDPTTYDAGYVTGEVFPCEHQNWFMNNLTSNGLTEQSNLNSAQSEIISVLTDQSITPNSGLTNQLLSAINGIVATPSRQGTGSPSSATFLRGDGSWSNALTGALSVSGNFSVNTNKFTVAASSGNTTVAGTLTVSGQSLFQNVAGATINADDLVANSTLTVAGGGSVGNTFNLGKQYMYNGAGGLFPYFLKISVSGIGDLYIPAGPSSFVGSAIGQKSVTFLVS